MSRLLKKLFVCVCIIGFVGVGFGVSPEEAGKIKSAVPEKAPAKAKKARKILVFSLCQGFKHSSIPYCVEALKVLGEKTGAYTSDETIDKSVFTTKNLKQYDAIVFNNTTKLTFDESQRKAIMSFVKGGKGIVGIHAATDNFYEWPEAATMMGGVFDGHPWGSGGTWDIRLEDPGHPLMKSFAGKDFSVKDEIYRTKVIDLRGNSRVLIGLDMSSKVNLSAKGIRPGENDIAISWLRKFGKGRVFYCSFGHNHAIYWNKAILGHYLAGIQFAIGDLKADTTPLAFDGSYLIKADDVKATLGKISDYKVGKNKTDLYKISEMVRIASAQKASSLAVEREFIAFLNSNATLAAKDFVCRELSVIGSEASAGVLGKLAVDKSTSDMARFAAERIQGAAIDSMLVEAAKNSSGNIRIGIINSLGARSSKGLTTMLAGMISNSDVALSLAAIEALRRSDDLGAMEALLMMKTVVSERLRVAALDAYISRADELAKAGKKKEAMTAYRNAYKSTEADVIRIAAVRGIMDVSGEGSVGFVMDILRGDDAVVKEVILGMLGDMSSSDIEPILQKFDNLSDLGKLQLLVATSNVKSRGVLKMAVKGIASDNQAVRVEAIRTLGRVGDESSVELLANISAKTRGNEQRIARNGLYGLYGVDGKVVELAGNREVDPSIRVELLRAISERRIADGSKVLVASVNDNDRKVRTQAWRSLSVVNGGDLAGLVKLMINVPAQADMKEAERTVLSVANSMSDKAKASGLVAGVMMAASNKGPEAQGAVLRVLGKIGHESSYEILTKALKSNDAKVQYSAVVGLSQWSGGKAAKLLKRVAVNGVNEQNRVVAFRGFVTQLSMIRGVKGSEVISMFGEAMKLAPSVGEKRKVLSALAERRGGEALDMAMSYLDNKELEAEAEIAVVKIAKGLVGSDPAGAKAALKSVIGVTGNEKLRKEAQSIVQGLDKYAGYILEWEMAGPYTGENSFEKVYAPEKGGSEVKWKIVQSDSGSGQPFVFNFAKIFGAGDNRAAYMRTNIRVKKARKAILAIGSDDGNKAWVNGKEVHALNQSRPIKPDSDKVEIELKAGWNTLMIKVSQLAGNWEGCARIISVDGGEIKGLRTKVIR